jgi:hypothetical protein
MAEKDTSVIPAGVYCYDESGRCPYWRLNTGRPEQMNGYCEYLELGDWMEGGTMLLWDQCKECGINNDDDE